MEETVLTISVYIKESGLEIPKTMVLMDSINLCVLLDPPCLGKQPCLSDSTALDCVTGLL